MQRSRPGSGSRSAYCFNPHRPRRADATGCFSRPGAVLAVSILTGPEGPMQLSSRPVMVAFALSFQSSPAPKGRCNADVGERTFLPRGFNPHRPRRADATFCLGDSMPYTTVSILTGPEGPMQPSGTGTGEPCSTVSILTGPEGPMQLLVRSRAANPAMFQSSPAPKGRCNSICSVSPASFQRFQSSPAPKGRCNASAAR